MKEMEKLGFEKDLTLQCIEANKHNNISTTSYYFKAFFNIKLIN